MRARPWVGVAVLRELGSEHPVAADLDRIREGIRYRDDEVVPDDELRAALERLRLAGYARLRSGRWQLTRAILAELPRTKEGSLSLFSEAFRAFGREHVEWLMPPELRDEVKHGALWHPTEDRGADVVYERYDEDRDLLAVVFARRGMFLALVYAKSRDYREWPMVWGTCVGESWLPTLDQAVEHLGSTLAGVPLDPPVSPDA